MCVELIDSVTAWRSLSSWRVLFVTNNHGSKTWWRVRYFQYMISYKRNIKTWTAFVDGDDPTTRPTLSWRIDESLTVQIICCIVMITCSKWYWSVILESESPTCWVDLPETNFLLKVSLQLWWNSQHEAFKSMAKLSRLRSGIQPGSSVQGYPPCGL